MCNRVTKAKAVKLPVRKVIDIVIHSCCGINNSRRITLGVCVSASPRFLNATLNSQLIRPIRNVQWCGELNVLTRCDWCSKYSSRLFIRSATHNRLTIDFDGKHQISLWTTTRKSTCCIHWLVRINSSMRRNSHLTQAITIWIIVWEVDQILCIAEKDVVSTNFSALGNHLRNRIFSWIHVQLERSTIGLYPVITRDDTCTVLSRFSSLSGNLCLNFSI